VDRVTLISMRDIMLSLTLLCSCILEEEICVDLESEYSIILS